MWVLRLLFSCGYLKAYLSTHQISNCSCVKYFLYCFFYEHPNSSLLHRSEKVHFPGSCMHYSGAFLPSNPSATILKFISWGAFANVWPPCGPLRLWIRPNLCNARSNCHNYASGIFCLPALYLLYELLPYPNAEPTPPMPLRRNPPSLALSQPYLLTQSDLRIIACPLYTLNTKGYYVY